MSFARCCASSSASPAMSGSLGARASPALVADQLRQRLASARAWARARILRRRRAADHDDRPRRALGRDPQDALRLGLLLLVAEPGDATAVSESVRGDEDALRHAPFVVGLAGRGRSV